MQLVGSRQYVTIHAKECRCYIYMHLVVPLLYLIAPFTVMDYFILTNA